MLDALSSPVRSWRGTLHGHSAVSDGTTSPENVYRRCRAGGYECICMYSPQLVERGAVGLRAWTNPLWLDG